MRNEPTLENQFCLVNNLIKERQHLDSIIARAATLLQNYSQYSYQHISDDLQIIAGKINAALSQCRDYRRQLEGKSVV